MDSKQNDTEKLKEIPKWTRKYAQNRTLTVFVLMAMICFMGGFIAFPVSFGLAALKGGNVLVAGICAAFFVVVLILLVVFVLKFGGKNRGWIDQKDRSTDIRQRRGCFNADAEINKEKKMVRCG